MEIVQVPSLRVLDLTSLLFPETPHPDWNIRFNPSIAKIAGTYFLVSYRVFHSWRYHDADLSWQEAQKLIQSAEKKKDALQAMWDEFLSRLDDTKILPNFISYVQSPAYQPKRRHLMYLVDKYTAFDRIMHEILANQPELTPAGKRMRGQLASPTFSPPLFESYNDAKNAYTSFVSHLQLDPARHSYMQAENAYADFLKRLEDLELSRSALNLATQMALYPPSAQFTLDLSTGEIIHLPSSIMTRYNDEVERKGHLPLFHPSRYGWRGGEGRSVAAIVAIPENKKNLSYNVRFVKQFMLRGIGDVRLIRDEEELKYGANEYVFLASGDNWLTPQDPIALQKILVRFPKAPPLTEGEESKITLISRQVTESGGLCLNIPEPGKNWTPFWLNRKPFFNFSVFPHRVIEVSAKPEKLSSTLSSPIEQADVFPTNYDWEKCAFLDEPEVDLTIPQFYLFKPQNYRFSLGTPALPWSTTEFIAVGHSRFNSRIRLDLPSYYPKSTESPVDTKNYHRLLDEFIAPRQEKIEENAALFYYFAYFFTFNSESMMITSLSHSFLFETHMPFLVEFPVGLEHAFPNDNPDTDTWVVSFGEGDMRIKLAFMSRKDITQLLVPVKEMMVSREVHKFLLLTREKEEVRKRKGNPLMTPQSKKTTW